jgi:Holliday junction resolvasome RuvABC endonuclease subunit
MGLDPSLTGFGLVVLGPKSRALRLRRYKTEPIPPTDGLKVRDTGQLAPDRYRGELEDRIAWLARKVLVSEAKYKPLAIAIEGYAFVKNSASLSSLHELCGVVKHEIRKTNTLFVVVSPTEVKLHATGNGKASKLDMIYAAKERDPRVNDSDTADAYWVADWLKSNYRKVLDI